TGADRLVEWRSDGRAAGAERRAVALHFLDQLVHHRLVEIRHRSAVGVDLNAREYADVSRVHEAPAGCDADGTGVGADAGPLRSGKHLSVKRGLDTQLPGVTRCRLALAGHDNLAGGAELGRRYGRSAVGGAAVDDLDVDRLAGRQRRLDRDRDLVGLARRNA